ncbi:hypothetical protein FACS1894122_08770 [Alphaproteobacteria bacterium]|nr:hypothetical protein FACS1894122_08770 [Alphaproteobacteria bacterium]
MHMQKTLQDKVFYDMANDFYEIKNTDARFSSLCIIGSIRTPAADNFFKLYPINNRLLPEYWDAAIYCMLGLYIRDINDRSLIRLDKEEVSLHNKFLLKSKQWYDIYSVGGSRILVELKGVDFKHALSNQPLIYHWR